MPERIQLRRTKGWRKPEGAVVVTRGTDWGNPFVVGQYLKIETPALAIRWRQMTPPLAVAMFRAWVEIMGFAPQIRDELAGSDLACWCAPGAPCHADVLLEIANQEAPV